jgi:protein-S-isoprenylcysteine O-methyltransferase Ste14
MDNRFAAWGARWRVPLGFAWGAAYLVFSQPTWRLLAIGGVVALAGVLIRATSAGFLEKGRKLAVAGPYRYTRNPLYLGSFLIGAGFAIAGGSKALALSFLFLFALIYGTVMRREEEFLRRQFGEEFDRFASAVPLFMPVFFRRGIPPGAEERFRWQRYWKNHEHEAALGFAGGIVFLALKIWLR